MSSLSKEELIELFEKEGWSWVYHDLRGGSMWDPEMPVGTNAKAPRDQNTARMKLLRKYYSLGTKPSVHIKER